MLFLLLLKMSLEDWKTHHIDLRDLIVTFMILFSPISLILMFLGIVLGEQRYCGIGDILLMAILCTQSVNIGIFLFFVGLFGMMLHFYIKQKEIPLIPVITVAFYLQKIL